MFVIECIEIMGKHLRNSEQHNDKDMLQLRQQNLLTSDKQMVGNLMTVGSNLETIMVGNLVTVGCEFSDSELSLNS